MSCVGNTPAFFPAQHTQSANHLEHYPHAQGQYGRNGNDKEKYNGTHLAAREQKQVSAHYTTDGPGRAEAGNERVLCLHNCGEYMAEGSQHTTEEIERQVPEMS